MQDLGTLGGTNVAAVWLTETREVLGDGRLAGIPRAASRTTISIHL